MTNEKGTKKPKTDSYVIYSSISIVILGFIGFILLGLDGWCAGGSFCSGTPGFESIIGAFLIALCVQILIIVSNKSKQNPTRLKDWIWTPIITIGIFLLVTVIRHLGK